MKYVLIETNSHSYGIALCRRGVPLVSCGDLSDNREDMRRLAALLNDLRVEPCHFEDVIEDYLTDFEVGG